MKPVEMERPDGGIDFKRDGCPHICVTTNSQGMGVVRCDHCHIDKIKGITELVCDLDDC